MARLFPFRSETEPGKRTPRIVGIDDENADAVFKALSSTKAREIYATLDDEPGTPSDVADAIDSSIQNVRYHLENLEDAGLIEVVDTWYSSRGNEMSVYATANGPLIVTSDPSTAERLKAALSRYLGGIAVLAGGSALVYYGVDRLRDAWPGPMLGSDGAGDGDVPGPADEGGANGEDAGHLDDANGDANGHDADAGDNDSGGDGDEAADEENGEDDDGEENGDGENGDEEDDGTGEESGGDGNESTTDEGDVGNESTSGEADHGTESTSGDGVDSTEGGVSVDEFGGENDVAFELGGSEGAFEVGGGTFGGESGVDRALMGGSGGDGIATGVASGDVGGTIDGAELLEVAIALVPPGALFFLASVVAVTAMTGYAYWTAT